MGKGPLSIQSMISGTSMTLKCVQSVASDLSKAGLIKTKSGPKGGLTLARRPSQINVLEIVEAVEGKINLMECLEHPDACGDHSMCSIMSVMYSAQSALQEKLKSTTLHLMLSAQKDPFNQVPAGNYQSPVNNCPAVKSV